MEIIPPKKEMFDNLAERAAVLVGEKEVGTKPTEQEFTLSTTTEKPILEEKVQDAVETSSGPKENAKAWFGTLDQESKFGATKNLVENATTKNEAPTLINSASLHENRVEPRGGFTPNTKTESTSTQEIVTNDPTLVMEVGKGDTPRNLAEEILNDPKILELFSNKIKDLDEESKEVLEILLGSEIAAKGEKYGLPNKFDANQLLYAA